MAKETLTKFINDNQGIITSIALFSGLTAFFIEFLQNNNTGSITSGFLPFISILLTIVLLVYMFIRLEKIKKMEKALWFFKILILFFLFFVTLFVLDYWPDSVKMFYKLGILFVILTFFLWFFKFNIRKGWLFGKYLIPLLIGYFYFTLSPILLLAAPNCVTNEYVIFGLYSFVFSIFIFMASVIIYTYSNMFDGIVQIDLKKKKNKEALKKSIPIIFGAFILAAVVVYLILTFIPTNLIVKWILKAILFPRTLFCN